MTLCNMAIEAGARVGVVAVDDKTIDYLKGRPFSPSGASSSPRTLAQGGLLCEPHITLVDHRFGDRPLVNLDVRPEEQQRGTWNCSERSLGL